MSIVFQQTILMKYHALFVIFEKAAKFESDALWDGSRWSMVFECGMFWSYILCACCCFCCVFFFVQKELVSFL